MARNLLLEARPETAPMAGRPPGESLKLRRKLDGVYTEAMKHLAQWVPLYRDVFQHYVPSRGRFTHNDPKKRGHSLPSRIVDETGTLAHGVAVSGLLSGTADPSRPWFELDTYRPTAELNHAGRVWLGKVRDVALLVYDRSNFYTALAMFYGDQLLVGTGAMLQIPDPETIVRFQVFPPGSYSLAQDAAGRVTTCVRDVTMTVQQCMAEFGDAVSPQVQAAAQNKAHEQAVAVRHAIIPNPVVSGGRREYDTDLPWAEVYWESAGAVGVGGSQEEKPHGTGWGGPVVPGGGILRIGGYHEFPVAVGRWERSDEDVFGVRCPGIDMLPAVKELQAVTKTTTNALEKMVDPPTASGPGLEGRSVSHLPGENTIDPDLATGGTGVRAMYQVNYAVDHASELVVALQSRIDRGFMVHLFTHLIQRGQSQPLTAEQVRALDRERVTVLGPIQEAQSDNFDVMIDRTLAMLFRASQADWELKRDGVLPLPPPELIDEPLRVKHVSSIARLQRTTALSGIADVAAFTANMAALWPEVVDKLNPDEAVELYADSYGTQAELLRSDDDVTAIRLRRQQQREQQMLREQAPGLAKAAKDMSVTRREPGTVLDAVAAGMGG